MKNCSASITPYRCTSEAGGCSWVLSDPTNQRVLEDIKFQTRLDIEPVIVSETQMVKALETAIDSQGSAAWSIRTSAISISAAESDIGQGRNPDPVRCRRCAGGAVHQPSHPASHQPGRFRHPL
jgi:hypothetical protein